MTCPAPGPMLPWLERMLRRRLNRPMSLVVSEASFHRLMREYMELPGTLLPRYSGGATVSYCGVPVVIDNRFVGAHFR